MKINWYENKENLRTWGHVEDQVCWHVSEQIWHEVRWQVDIQAWDQINGN